MRLLLCRLGRVARVLGVAVPLAVVIRLAPPPGAAVAMLRHPQAAVDALGPDAVALTVVGAACWVVLLWLAAALLAVTAAALPGRLGRVAEVAARAVVPGSLRRLLAIALGVGLSSGLAAAPALAAGPRQVPAPPVASLDLDWPVSAGPASGSEAVRPGEVVVRAGDTLWGIARRQLGAGASATQVAAGWRRWYAANRQVIGPDPALILPGQRLTPPTAAPSAPAGQVRR